LQVYVDDSIDIHHIFPQHWCRQNSVDLQRADSIVNKTALSARTNRLIGGRAPSKYLKTLQREFDIDEERMDEMLATHRIQPAALRANDFDAFFDARRAVLLVLIEDAMGKTTASGVA